MTYLDTWRPENEKGKNRECKGKLKRDRVLKSIQKILSKQEIMLRKGCSFIIKSRFNFNMKQLPNHSTVVYPTNHLRTSD